MKNCRRAFSLVELLVTIGIVGLLIALVVAAFIRVGDFRKTQQTKATLATLDSVIDEYHTQTGAYFEGTGVYSDGVNVTTPKAFLIALGVYKNTSTNTLDQGVGGIYNLLVPIKDSISTDLSPPNNSFPPSDSTAALALNHYVGINDGWGNPLMFYNPNASPATNLRPWFWSLGPNGVNDSGDSTHPALAPPSGDLPGKPLNTVPVNPQDPLRSDPATYPYSPFTGDDLGGIGNTP